MVTSCCAVGCTYRFKKGGVGLFTFPKEKFRRLAWIRAVRRKDWEPTENARVCGHHFQTGRPSRDEDHPDYVPNVFFYTKGKIRSVEQYEKIKREKERPKIILLEKSNSEEPNYILPTISALQGSFITEGYSEDAGDLETITPVEESMLSEEENSTVGESMLAEEENSTVDEPTIKRENSEDTIKNIKIIIPGDVEPKMSISSYQKTVSKLKAENERLQDEVRRSKIDNMVDIALEMSTLRDEIRTLKEKLNKAQFSTLLLSDMKKLQYYTGMKDLDTFNNIVQSSKDLIDAAFTISEETQLLIVLVKLKMKFQEEDLAVRFNVSRRTIRRVLDTWLPILSFDSDE